MGGGFYTMANGWQSESISMIEYESVCEPLNWIGDAVCRYHSRWFPFSETQEEHVWTRMPNISADKVKRVNQQKKDRVAAHPFLNQGRALSLSLIFPLSRCLCLYSLSIDHIAFKQNSVSVGRLHLCKLNRLSQFNFHSALKWTGCSLNWTRQRVHPLPHFTHKAEERGGLTETEPKPKVYCCVSTRHTRWSTLHYQLKSILALVTMETRHPFPSPLGQIWAYGFHSRVQMLCLACMSHVHNISRKCPCITKNV